MDDELRRILSLYDETAALKDAHTIPAPWYRDGAMARLEDERVFGGNWQAIGRCDQLRRRGIL